MKDKDDFDDQFTIDKKKNRIEKTSLKNNLRHVSVFLTQTIIPSKKFVESSSDDDDDQKM